MSYADDESYYWDSDMNAEYLEHKKKLDLILQGVWTSANKVHTQIESLDKNHIENILNMFDENSGIGRRFRLYLYHISNLTRLKIVNIGWYNITLSVGSKVWCIYENKPRQIQIEKIIRTYIRPPEILVFIKEFGIYLHRDYIRSSKEELLEYIELITLQTNKKMAIKKIQNLEFKKNLTMLIYGQKGIGKTTLALSASPNTLLIDADNGANRVSTEHLMTTGVIQVQNYNEIMADLDTDLSVYDTIIIDTLGKLIGYMIDSLRAQNAKWGSPQGGLSMQGWGMLNMSFQFFYNKLKSMCKHLIFIAHEIVEKRGDVIRLIPDVRMNNYAWLATELDLIGYVEYKGQDRIISFSPSEEHDGKNTGGFDNQIKVPLLQAGAPNNFLATTIISKHFDNVEDKEKLQKAVAERFSDIDNIINSINDADDANICANEIKQLEHIGTSLQYAQTQFKRKVRALGLQYDKDTKSYI